MECKTGLAISRKTRMTSVPETILSVETNRKLRKEVAVIVDGSEKGEGGV